MTLDGSQRESELESLLVLLQLDAVRAVRSDGHEVDPDVIDRILELTSSPAVAARLIARMSAAVANVALTQAGLDAEAVYQEIVVHAFTADD